MKVKYICFQTKSWIISEKQASPKEKLKDIKPNPSDLKTKKDSRWKHENVRGNKE